MNNKLVYYAIFVLLLILQITVIPFISFNYIVPDLILILLVFLSLQFGQVYGTVHGFVFGLIFDLATGGLFGASMLSKTLAAFIAGYFFNVNKTEQNTNTYMFAIIVFVAQFVDKFVYSVFTSFDSNISILFMLIEQGILPAIYSSLLSFIYLLIVKPGRSFI